jgi:hypothetical protein
MNSIPWAGTQPIQGGNIPGHAPPAGQQSIMALADEANEVANGLSA